jgi:hypothetical protein
MTDFHNWTGSALTRAAYRAPLVVVDIDGTLSLPDHRVHLLGAHAVSHTCLANAPRSVIDAFMAPELVAIDAPIEEACSFVRAWHRERKFRYLTGRWESLRFVTEHWLKTYCDWHAPLGDMRPEHRTHESAVSFKLSHALYFPAGTVIIDDDEEFIVALARIPNKLHVFHAPACFGGSK